MLDEFRYVIYDSTAHAIYSNEETSTLLLSQSSVNPYGIASASTASELSNIHAQSIRIIHDISTLQAGCYTFLPVGFMRNEIWKHVKLTIKLNGVIKHTLISGASSSANPYGVIGLNIGGGTCAPGCGNSVHEFNPPTCSAIAVQDEDGVLDMKLIVQLSQVEQSDAYNNVKVQVLNIQTGKVVAQIGGNIEEQLIPGTTYAETFTMTEPDTLGVKVVNNAAIVYPVEYKIIANNNQEIMSKRISWCQLHLKL